jgi:PAS domain S-box-containing protein
MHRLYWFDTDDDARPPEELWEEGDRRFFKIRRKGPDGADRERIVVFLDPDRTTPGNIRRLLHEFSLREFLGGAWALQPLELVQDRELTMLVLEHHDGRPLDRLMGLPMETGQLLRLGVALLAAVRQMHERGLVHKDLKPANVLVTPEDEVRLTGFGIASLLPRERQAPDPPEVIAGTLPYMAPEQTGRMNRSIDSRSDLYSLGIVLYQMATGSLPFQASDPMEWVHCHIARRPAAPRERFGGIPVPVSAIIMKLLAKTPEERYQTAAGAEHDLRRCLAEWQAGGSCEAFAIAEQDHPDRMVIPEKLYGRAREVEALLSSFDDVAASGVPALVLVTGEPGAGKSSVVNELRKVLVMPRALFASGKFDQYKADIPYATFSLAFQSLVRPLLGQTETELGRWREALSEALNPNAALLLDLVPELKLILGEQPPVMELPAQDAQRRFHLVVRRFIGVFARPEHPLALFLDDLQWLDAATLDLLVDLLTAGDVRHLLLIGAYRDEEVGAHPLAERLAALRQGGAVVRTVTLPPLSEDDLLQLVADALHAPPNHVRPLAGLVQRKTAGNPLFAVQFLNSLAEEGLLAFHHATARWAWDEERTLAKGFADNVVDLMVRKLGRLPEATRQALQRLACLGHGGDAATLGAVCGKPMEEVEAQLWEALHQELIQRTEGAYRFAHDRVQEAAYSLIPEESRAQLHLDIGRRLLAHTPAGQQKEAVFDLVNQLNRGAHLVTAAQEREQLAELNFIAGNRSKASVAYASALDYFKAGAALLPEDGRELRHDLSFSLALAQAECEFLTGDTAAAEARLMTLSSRAANSIDRATVACLSIDLYTTLDRSDRAVEVCLAYLRHLGIDWPAHPPEEVVRREYDRMWLLIGNREIEELIDLPLMSDPRSIATLDVLTKAQVPASFTDANLFSLLLWKIVNLSLEHGNTDASCQAYGHIGRIVGPRFGDYGAGVRFAQLGYDLVERRGLKRFQARTYLGYAVSSVSWTHFRVARDLMRRALDVANSTGDVTYAAFSRHHLVANLLAAGDPLFDVQCEAERAMEFARKARFGLESDVVAGQLALVRTLRGSTPTFGRFDDANFNETEFERRISSDPRLVFAACWYWIRKLQARFFAGDYAAALAASSNAQRLLWTPPSFFRTAEAHFYGVLSRAACCDAGSAARHQEHLEALLAHHKELLEWAKNCPENFENRAALLGAEIARIEGRELDAERLYEAAIDSARENGFVHNQALAAELAARFYAARGFDTIARAYLRDARHSYLKWGATGKVRQLDERYPYLRDEDRAAPSAMVQTSLDHLDLATVLKVSRAVSAEIDLEKLIATVMRLALEHAGAQRGLLMLPHGDGYRIEAEAKVETEGVTVDLQHADISAEHLPASVFHFVLRAREGVLLQDASGQGPFSDDDYIRRNHARSVLCLPLLKQTRLVGVIYVENNLTPGVFAPARLALLELLASEAAISLENARLYRDVQEREGRVRRLFDSNIIGIFTWSLDGRILDGNRAFGEIVGYSDDELSSGQMRWKDLMPAWWDEGDDQIMRTLQATSVVPPFEGEYFRKDGSIVPVLIGIALFDGKPAEGVAFVLDLTDRKKAEQAALDSERRYHDVELKLLDANRVASIAQLSASIAHEINQPLSGIITNAGTGLRMLDADPPNIDGARETAKRTIRDGNRAADVIARLRALFSKGDLALEPMDLNEATREVVGMMSSDLERSEVVLQLDLDENLPSIAGARIQLQQVILNLIRNASEAMADVHDRPRHLSISTALEPGDRVRVSVKDAGVGLDSQSLHKIFDAFYSTKSAGMGIGLSVSRSIIERHNGRLWAEPNDPHGTTFQFSVPLG